MPTLHGLPAPSFAWQGRSQQAQVVVDDMSLVVMDYEHFRIHQSDMYHLVYVDLAVANNGKIEVLLSTTLLTHVTFNALTEGLSYASLLEAPTYSGGTILPTHNRNRQAALEGNATPVTGVYKHSPTVTVDGNALVDEVIVPGGSSPARPSAGGRTSVEWLLAPGVDYVARLTNKSGSDAWMELQMDIYEDTHPYPGG